MKPFVAFAALAVAVAFGAPVTAEPTAASGVVVPVALLDALSTKDAQAGETFRFETLSDVQAGQVTIPAQTMGEGIVKTAHTGHFMSSSKLELQPVALHLASGEEIPVTFDPSTEPNGKSQAHIFPFPVMFVPVPLFGAFINPAKEVSVPVGTRFSVVTR
jgi:hypothetical protein